MTPSGIMERFAYALHKNPPRYLTEQGNTSVLTLVNDKNLIYIDSIELIREVIDKYVEDKDCPTCGHIGAMQS